ncbi:(-)-kolavenyl diphosphate synthase TPS28, chloroplastic isoform X2 [Helianthus annuus]|uniref:(-)-kolavenyl diphosphate synthase TPS28, chloroplastic isoform X2 n=1 Tax=Helianthus annuus TaxID=4232 RepID=UPI0016531117|nr:(-)-kolavenyl diphosphate synthase TPS28, chloroplastic isoform X2 [Helianthus annuus]
MGIINSPPPTTTNATVFRRRLSQTTTFCPTCSSTGIFFTFSYNFVGHIKSVNFKCQAILKPYEKDVLQHIEMPFVEEDHAIKNYVKSIKSIFGSVDDGVISPSAYDTAWVALIEGVNEQSGGPQFPSSLEWIANHQLLDGSWGESMIFSISDRLVNTLACVIALTTWKVHPDKCKKGLNFVEDNIYKLGDQNEEHKTHGLELVFPALIELAGKLDLKVPNDSPVIKEMYKRRERKLLKIPKEKVHNTPTIMIYSLEGMKDLEWDKLLKLQSENGSIVYSPSATAFSFMQTKDQKCLTYLTNLVHKFKGGVPHVYPVEIFEQIWMVDRLQRLGIARYFQSEIKECTDYIYRYWDGQAIGITRYCNLPDIDDTYVLRHFEKDGQFVCYPGQSSEAVTAMFNLYRASQVLFPGEKILDDAKKFSYNFLTEKRSTNELLDKWLITKDLPGEVVYALDVPWYASLPRLEARYYLEQYGGEDDIWIGKTLYRMENISNNQYLEMAKLDYNQCQTIHQLEWTNIQKWYAHLNIKETINTRLLNSYYEAATSIFEPERCNKRVAWAKTNVIVNTITSFFARPHLSNTGIQAFAYEFTNTQHHEKNRKPWDGMMNALHETLNEISLNTRVAYGVDIYPHLHSIWKVWLLNLQNGVDKVEGEAELIVKTINLCSSQCLLDESFSHPQYQRLSSIINDICHQISHKGNRTISFEIESKMQELVQLVLCDSPDDLDTTSKQTFLMVAKTFYYRALFDPETINQHIGKVLFENVI